jgi:hypothetical protein
MFTFNPKKTTPLRYAYTWTIPFLLWAICPTLLSGQTAISLGDDGLVGENETVELSATINIPGEPPPGSGLISSSEAFTLLWYKRTIDEANYPAEPFATSGVEIGETTATLSDSPIEESTYYKVVLSDQTGVACEDEVLAVRAKLQKVLFLNSLPLYRDPVGAAPIPFVPETPALPNNWHWYKDDLGNAKPVWYRMGNTLEMSALLQLKGIDAAGLENLKIRATGTIGFELTTSEPGLVSIGDPADGLYVSALSLLATQAFPDNIAVFEEFLLNWQYNPNNGSDWKNLGNSVNTCYISRQPLDELAGQRYFHTTVHLSCTAAQGQDDEQAIVNNIYKLFTTRDVKKYGAANAMNYWGNTTNNYYETIDLIRYGTGRCGAWARFFVDMLAIQGISVDLKRMTRSPLEPMILQGQSLTNLQAALGNAANAGDITFDSNTAIANGCFLVKHWNVQPNHFYIRLNTSLNPNEFYKEYIDPIDNNVAQDGVPAQSNDNPRSRFYDHVIIKYNDNYYDPSYGSYGETAGTTVYNAEFPPFESLIEWEQHSITSMGATFGFNSDEILWIENDNPETLDLIENNQNY